MDGDVYLKEMSVSLASSIIVNQVYGMGWLPITSVSIL